MRGSKGGADKPACVAYRGWMDSAFGRSVLVIEDEAYLRSYMSEILRSEGFNVFEARDATEAFQQLQRSEPLSLVITDVQMPGYVNGAMFAHVISEYRPHVPIIVISGHAEPRSSELPAGTIFLPKPFTASELLNSLERQLASE